MDEGVVEGGEDAGDAEDEFTYSVCQWETFLPLQLSRDGIRADMTNLL